jgi:hypothetical protein
MELYRMDRDSEATRDRFVRCALGQEVQYLYFARCECGVLFGSLLRSL